MSIVTEIIHIVPEEREQYLREHLDPSREIQQVLWRHGIRQQHYFELNDLIIRSYEYVGSHYYLDMGALTANPVTKDFFVQKRRKDVPEGERKKTNWWAPLKRLGRTLMETPFSPEQPASETEYEEAIAAISGGIVLNSAQEAFRYDAEEWEEALYI